MPPNTPTIGDLITTMKDAKAILSRTTQALAEAISALATATAAASDSDAAFGAGLAESGPVFDVTVDETAEIYSPGAGGTYHVTLARPVTTSVGGAPVINPLREMSPMPKPDTNKHQLHDAIEAHITGWASHFGMTFDKHDVDEFLRLTHVKQSLDLATGGNLADVAQLRQALAAIGGMADFMASQGAGDPLVGRTVAAMQGLLDVSLFQVVPEVAWDDADALDDETIREMSGTWRYDNWLYRHSFFVGAVGPHPLGILYDVDGEVIAWGMAETIMSYVMGD